MRYVCIFLVLLLFPLAANGESTFYYGASGKIDLQPVNDMLIVKLSSKSDEYWESFVSEHNEYFEIIKPIFGLNGYDIYELKPDISFDQVISAVLLLDDVADITPVYKNSYGELVFSNDQIIVSFKESAGQLIIDGLISALNIKVVEHDERHNYYIFSLGDLKSLSAISIANELHESEYVEYAHPNFGVTNFLHFTPNDSLYSYQYYINNTSYPAIDIDMANAWDITLGDSSVTIAVIDDAFQRNHPDLDSNLVLQGHDFIGVTYKHPLPDNDPSPDSTATSTGHGMECAGLIFAQTDNNRGIAGIAPKTKMLPLKITDDIGAITGLDTSYVYSLPSVFAQAIYYAVDSGAQVISISWGFHGYYFQNIEQALIYAYNSGTVVVASAGNDTDTMLSYPANSAYTLAVGAVNQDGSRCSFSNTSSDLDVMAPSGAGYSTPSLSDDVMTLDMIGSGGDNPFIWKDIFYGNHLYANCTDIPYEYYCKFGGTSAAAPQIAGIVGLVLSRRPDFRDLSFFRGSKVLRSFFLFDIIRKSAVDQTGYAWEDIPGKDNYHGYGLANAYRALLSVSRGDVDNSGEIDVNDIVYLRDYMFCGGSAPMPDIRMADCDCVDGVDISDLIYMIDFQFYGGPPLVTPCYSF